MTNAIVRNARAKTIERRFCDVKNQISRLFDTFCGGTVVEKPEQLKHLLKGGEVVLDSDFTASVQTLLDGPDERKRVQRPGAARPRENQAARSGGTT